MDVDLTLDDLLAKVRRLEAELASARATIARRAESPAVAESAQAVRESEARYRAVLEYAPAQVLLFEDGHFTFANPAAAQMLGFQHPEEVFGLTALELVAEPHRDLVRARIANIEAGIANPPLEIQFLRTDGTLVWSQITSAPLTLNGRRVALVCGIDVTARRRIEAENARMQESMRGAQRLEAVGTLASGLAHDFNNILGIIQGRVSLLLADAQAHGRNQDDLLTIESQVATAANLTRQLLDYGRRGAQQLRPLDLNAAVVESAAIFGRTRKDILIETHLEPGLPACEGDATQISQALLNLYVNAADAMPGGGRLELRTMRTTSDAMVGRTYLPVPGDYVRLTVADTGVGIPAEVLPHIFEPFFTTKERGCGTGLGLASVYGAVKTCQGYVDVDSTPGRGTTFTLHFPATARPADAAPAPVRTVAAGRGVVLLIDDEDQVRATTAMMLRRLGYDVAPAADGPAALALQAARRDEITLVVLDLYLPGMGGRQVYEELRLRMPRVPVLLASGAAVEGPLRSLLADGYVSFLPKPYTLQQLSLAVTQAIAPR
jgi:two-component system, cell cycle sensor histidine kinase and response regulator CckA